MGSLFLRRRLEGAKRNAAARCQVPHKPGLPGLLNRLVAIGGDGPIRPFEERKRGLNYSPGFFNLSELRVQRIRRMRRPKIIESAFRCSQIEQEFWRLNLR